MPLSDLIRDRIDEAKNLLDGFDSQLVEQIAKLVELITEAYRNDKKLIFMGNGGSAADAQHLAAELVGRFFKERTALQALALNTNTSIITALANDYGYEHIFRRQIEAIARQGDVVIGISTSGNSPNVLEALMEAKRKACHTIGLTGRSGGKMKNLVDICLCMPSSTTPRIQENHILVGHIMCELVEQQLFENTV